MNPRLQRCAAFLLLLGFALLQVLPSQARTFSKGDGCHFCAARCSCCMQPASRGDSSGSAPVAATRESNSSEHAVIPVLSALIASAAPPEPAVRFQTIPPSQSSPQPLYTRHCSLLI